MTLYCELFSEAEVRSCLSEIFKKVDAEIILCGNDKQIEVSKSDYARLCLEEVCSKNVVSNLYHVNFEVMHEVNMLVDEFNPYEYSCYGISENGVQSKFTNTDEDIVKADSWLKEGLNESLAYAVSKYISGVKFVQYKSCIVQTNEKLVTGCVSRNLKKYGVRDYSALNSLVNKSYEFSSLSRTNKIEILSKYVDVHKLFKLLAFDVLICNTDRHLGNICVLENDLCEWQYDNGRAFATGTDANLFMDSLESISSKCNYPPLDYTLRSFVEDYRKFDIEPLTVDIEGLKQLANNCRSILYSPKAIRRRLELVMYQLSLTEGVLWRRLNE